MDYNHLIPGWNAHRHPSSPIAQPKYRFEDVPKCQRSLEGSVIQEITTREAFKEIMGEMVLLCNEAMKRSRAGRTASKPLSLEYIADRLDVDDPCFGYIIRSNKGHLQGFITVTTFTNWQKNFKWDSLNDVSFYYDDDGDPCDNPRGGSKMSGSPSRRKKASSQTPRKHPRRRVVDEDGTLAKALQKTVKLGDPYNEGIVWPRIAEISLLGALGCGKALVQLVIEQLEFQRASGVANYDYVALQATDNSIPFYESAGFVRVGAVTYDTKDQSSKRDSRSISPTFSTESTASETTVSSRSAAAAEPVEYDPKSSAKPESLAISQSIVSSPHFLHEVVKPGETPNEIAKRFKVCVWDIIFLNKDIYEELRPTSRLIKGTILHVPRIEAESQADDSHRLRCPGSPTKWFVAKENDTPRQIAKRFGLACNALVSANRRLLPELQATSRLKAGTRLKITNLEQEDEVCQPYCHWSFPEDTAVEGGEPSYMMVYKLDRKTARNPRTVRDSLAVPVGKHSPPTLLFPPPPKTSVPSSSENELKESTSSRQLAARTPKVIPATPAPQLPKQPSRPEQLKKHPPQSGKDVFWEHQKEMHPELIEPTEENEKIIKDRWSRLRGYKKEKYHTIAAETRKIYGQIEKDYDSKVSQWRETCKKLQEAHHLEEQRNQTEAASKRNPDNNFTLFNKVVKLREDALEGEEFKYWFVLTYIPDLKWCHLAPMYQDGHFGPDRKRAHGRPRYRLVDEKLGKEIDISSSYCIPVRSRALRHTVDADKEEWDIQDGHVQLVKEDNNVESIDVVCASGTRNGVMKLSKTPKFGAAAKQVTGTITIGTTGRIAQNSLKRARRCPLEASRKRPHDEVSESEIKQPVKLRNRRRCVRCVENGASYDQAVVCLGAKGRFGREACQFYDSTGAETAKALLSPPRSARKPRRCSRCVEFGAIDEQAAQCPGAKGRLGRSSCVFFLETGDNIERDKSNNDSLDSEDLNKPLRKMQRNDAFKPEVMIRKDAQVELVLTPTRSTQPSLRPHSSSPIPGLWASLSKAQASIPNSALIE